jgi:hypothetical protein
VIEDGQKIEFLMSLLDPNDKVTLVAGFRVPHSLAAEVREQVRMFNVQLFAGYACALVAVLGLLWDVANSIF